MDSTPTIVRCIQDACRDLALPVPEDSVASHVIGLGIQESLRKACPTVSVDDHYKLIDRFRFHYLSKDHELSLFEGAKAIALDIGMSKAELRHAIDDTLKANAMTDGVHVRLMVSRGIKRTPYQDPRACIGNATVVIVPEYKQVVEI